MTTVQIYAAGSFLVAFDSASVSRSASDLITTAQIQAPLNILSEIQADNEIAIEVDRTVLFHGLAADWTLNYSGGNTSISIPCVDLSYNLTHMVAVSPMTLHSGTAQAGAATTITLESGAETTDDYYNGFFIEITGGTGEGQVNQISDYNGSTLVATMADTWTTTPDNTSEYRMFRGYPSNTDIGAVIYDLLADTGIDRSHINQATGVTLDEDYEISSGTMRMSVIQDLTKKYNSLFYLSYGKLGDTFKTYGEFDTYASMEASGDFATEHEITDANTPIFSLSIKNQPDMACTRVIAIRDSAGVQEVGTATTGAAPYLDKVVSVNVNDTTDIDTLAADYLANFTRNIAKLDLSFHNLAVSLFNVVDLSAVCDVLGVTLPLMEFRVTDLDYTISADGIVTKTTGVDPDAELWDVTVREQVGEQTVGNVVQAEAEYQAEEAKPVYATVIA